MAVIHPGAPWPYEHLVGHACFYCHLPVEPPAVVWFGSEGTLLLHPGCVLDLFVRLARDVHEIECTTGRPTTVLALRCQIEQQEGRR